MSIQSLNEQTKFSTALQWPFNAQSICENYLSSNRITSRLPGFGLTCLLSEGPRNLWGLTHKYSFLEQWNPFTLQQRFFYSAISNGCSSFSNLTACLRSNNSEDKKKYLNLCLRHAWRATAEFTAWYYGSPLVFSSLQKVEAIANLIKPDWCQKAINSIVGLGDSVVNYICGSRNDNVQIDESPLSKKQQKIFAQLKPLIPKLHAISPISTEEDLQNAIRSNYSIYKNDGKSLTIVYEPDHLESQGDGNSRSSTSNGVSARSPSIPCCLFFSDHICLPENHHGVSRDGVTYNFGPTYMDEVRKAAQRHKST